MEWPARGPVERAARGARSSSVMAVRTASRNGVCGFAPPRQRRAVQRVRHVPQVPHLLQRGHQGHEGRRQAHQAPGQPAGPQRPVARQPALLPGHLGQRGQPVLPGDGVAGEVQNFAQPRLAPGFGHVHKHPGQIGQVGPGMRCVEGARPGDAALRQLFHDHLIQPRAAAGTEEIPRADHCGGQAVLPRALRQLLLQFDADAALGGGWALRGVRRQHRRHVRAEVVHIAGEQQVRAQRGGQVDGRLHQAGRFGAPGRCGVGRVHRVHDHARTSGGALQGGRISRIGLHPFDAGHRRRRRAAGAPLRQHPPARGRKGLRHRAAQPAPCAQNQNRVVHVCSP